jgi:hypothetical protein
VIGLDPDLEAFEAALEMNPDLLEGFLTTTFEGAFCVAAAVEDFAVGTGLAAGADRPQSGLDLATVNALTPPSAAAELGPAAATVDVAGLDFAGFAGGTRSLREVASVEVGFFFTGAGGTTVRLGWLEDDATLSTLDVGRLGPSDSFLGAQGTGGGAMGTRRGPVVAPTCEAIAAGGCPELNCTL